MRFFMFLTVFFGATAFLYAGGDPDSAYYGGGSPIFNDGSQDQDKISYTPPQSNNGSQDSTQNELSPQDQATAPDFGPEAGDVDQVNQTEVVTEPEQTQKRKPIFRSDLHDSTTTRVVRSGDVLDSDGRNVVDKNDVPVRTLRFIQENQ